MDTVVILWEPGAQVSTSGMPPLSDRRAGRPPMNAMTNPARYGLVPVSFVFGELVEHPRQQVVLSGESVLVVKSGQHRTFVGMGADGEPVLAQHDAEAARLSREMERDRLRHESAKGTGPERVAARFVSAAIDESNPIELLEALVKTLNGHQLTFAAREVERAGNAVRQAWADLSTVVTWDWRPAARHVVKYMEATGTPPVDVWMEKSPGQPVTLMFALPNQKRPPKFDQRKFETMRGQLGRLFQMKPSPVDESLYTLPDGQRVRVSIGFGGSAQARGGEKLAARFLSNQASLARREGMTYDPSVTEGSPLEGLRKGKVLDILNRLLDPHTKGGIHHDNSWAPVHAMRREWERENLPVILQSANYEHEGNVPVRKVWLYEVPFTNQNGRPDKVYIRIVASGAGSSREPLEAYDVTAYAS